MSDEARRICLHGGLLVLIGLASGALVPFVTNPRMGLSAHVSGVQGGVLLLALGLVWGHLRLAEGARRACRLLCVGSLYLLWAATLLAAVLGTSGTTPIAGAGHEGSAAAETLVGAMFAIGSLAVLAGVALVVWGLGRRAA